MNNTTIAQRSWRRAIAMLFVAMRYEIELRFLARELIYDDEEFSKRLWTAFDRHKDLYDELTTNERILLRYEIGKWPLSVHTQYSWHVEAVGCLLWCLGEFKEFPSHDNSFELKSIDKYFGTLGQQGITSWTNNLLEKSFDLIDGNIIQRELKRAEIVYQRCIIGSYIRDGKRKMTTKRYDDLFSFEQYGLPVGPGGDLEILGMEFCDTSKEIESDIAPLSLIRVQTFRWIMDPSENWDSLTVDHLENLPE